MKGAQKLGLLGALYLSQGLPYGFFTQALPALLRELGLSLPAIGLTSLLALPWALKFLWAPLVDRWGSRRRWILAMQAVAALLAVVISTIDPDRALPLILGCVLLTNLAAATQDIATDGLAVSMLSSSERGLGNGIQVAGYRLGMILGGGVLLVLFERLGWQGTFLCMAALIAAASLPLITTPALGARQASGGGGLREALGWLVLPGNAGWLGALALYKVGHHLAQGMLRPWLVDSGMGLADIGWLLGAGGFSAGLVGAILGGLSVNVLGRRAVLGAWGLAAAAGVAGYASLASSGVAGGLALWGVVLVEHLASGMATAALFTVMMDACREEHESSDYTLQASAVVIASGVAAAASGFVAEAIGYGGLLWCASALGVLGAAGAVAGARRAGSV